MSPIFFSRGVGCFIMFVWWLELFTSSLKYNERSGEPTTPTDKTFRDQSSPIIEGYGVIPRVPVQHNKILNFHKFEVYEFKLHVGHPIEKFFFNVQEPEFSTSSLGKWCFLSRSHDKKTLWWNPVPKFETIVEVLAVSPFESPESLLEDDFHCICWERGRSWRGDRVTQNRSVFTTSIVVLKPLPSGLRHAFLHGDSESPVDISDKLSDDLTSRLTAMLAKHCSILGYFLQVLKGISPALYTHHIPLDPSCALSWEPQQRLNNTMREVVKKRSILCRIANGLTQFRLCLRREAWQLLKTWRTS